ncbi:hypothetical protein TSUD_288800 [Trifolium subterraneum]|uniref:SHSP domain-containing protein n=1 Tax=Trifolium subterraneum TaxID=3900 RepID=A0A2Z6MGZ2_TRISU|nr:hypothetical protein TSUD_288800 [Trifolium subterraneum]
MELELGLKITKTRDDIDSISEYQFMKDTGPVFKSRETNTMFILTAHLKGYKRNNIDINISKDGNKISIRGKKPIQEMVMMGWVMQRKVVDVKGFNKVFKIPYGVNLDKIKANYNEEEWMLNIVMPKLVRGVFGLKIEEFKEQEFDKGKKEQGKSDFDHVSSNIGETSQKGSKEYEFQHMEGSENIIEKMIDDTKKEINEERILKEVGEYKLRIEDGNGESVREKIGKEEYEASKKLEMDQSVGVFMSKENEDISQDKEFEDQKLNSISVEKRLDDVNRDLIGSTIKKDKEESKLRIKDSKVKDTSQLGFEESMIQESGESKQKEFEEPKCESMKESSKEPFEAMKVPKLDENVVDHIPNNIGCINQTQFKEENEKPPFEAYEDVQETKFGDTIQKGIIKANKEGFDAKITINEEESEGLNNQNMQETKNEKEEMVGKEVEYFVEKGGCERLKKMHVEPKKDNNIRDTMKTEIEEGDNGIKESGQQQVAEMKESKGFNVTKEEEQKEVKKEVIDENECLIVEGNESKERTKEIVKDVEDKIENSIVKLKGEGSTKIHVEPNEPFEGENVNNEIFDRRDTKMFHEIEQTKDVNEENEGFKKNKTKAEDEWVLQEEMSKGRSKANKASKEDLPKKFSNSPIDTREGQKNTRIEKVKGIKESEKESSMKPFQAKEDVNKDFVNPKVGFDAEINEEIQNYLPKSTNEQNEGLNVEKRPEIKDIKENVVKRKGKEIEYFVEKGEGGRLKSMHVKEIKGNNTIETMQDEIEKSEHGIKENGQQYANENVVKEMYEVSKSETEELPRQVAKIDGSKEFDVAKEEEKYEVLNEALVESESLVEMVQGEESNEMTKAIDQDEDIEKLKETGPAKIHFEPNDPFEGDKTEEKIEKEIRNQKLESINELSDKEIANIGIFDGRKTNKFQEIKQTEDVNEKNAKIGKFANTLNEKIQNEEDEDLKKNTTKEKDECCLQEEVIEGRCQASKDIKEDFSMKMSDSQIDAREGPKDGEMEKTKGVKEESAKVKREEYENIQVEENEGLKNDITKRKQSESDETKLVTKFKDQQSLEKEKSKGRNEASTIERKHPMKTVESLAKSREGPKHKEIEEQNFDESTTKEELQGFEIETISQGLFEESEENNSKAEEIGTSEREFQSVASTGFKEFDYGNAKDKKHNTKKLPSKFQSNETHESNDLSTDKDILNQKKTQEGGEQCNYNNVSAKEVGAIDQEVVKSLSTPKYKGCLESKRQDHTKDIQSFIEMKENKNEEDEQNVTFKQEMPLEKDLKKGEKGEFLNEEPMQEKTNDEDFKIHGEITKDGIEKDKCIHATMKTTQKKEAEPLESSLKNDIVEMKTKRPLELEKTIVHWKFPKTKDQHDIEEMKLPNNQQSTEKMKAIGEHEATKDSPKLNIVETAKIDSLQPQFLDGQENVLQEKKESKVANIEDKHDSTLQTTEEKVHDTPYRELQREVEEVTSKIVEPSITVEKIPATKGERKDSQELPRPNLGYEISKLEEVQKDNEVKSRINALEESIYKEEGTNANEVESLEANLNNDSVQHEQHESGTEEIQEPKNATYQEANTSKLPRSKVKQQLRDEINRKSEENIESLPPHLLDEQKEVLHVQEKNDKKGFHTPIVVEEERVVKKREGPMVAKNEENNNSSTLKRVSEKSKSKEENQPKMKEITTQFEKDSETKRVEEKVHQTPKKEHQRKLEVTSTIEVAAQTTVEKTSIKGVEMKEPLELTSPPNMVNEILKVEEKEGQKHIQVLQATIPKGKEDRGHQYVQEKNNKKEFETQKTSEEEKVVKKMEEAKVAKSEETKNDCTFKRQAGKTTPAPKFDKASSGSKRVEEKVHETLERNHQRELEEVTSKMRVEQPTTVENTPTNMDNEIPKVKEFRNEEVERHIQELEANISKEKEPLNHFPSPKEPFQQCEVEGEEKTKKKDSKIDAQEIEQDINKDKEAKHGIEEQKESNKVVVPSTSCPQQFEVEGEENPKKRESKLDVHESEKCKRGQEIEQCINDDEEAKHGIEEIKDEEKEYEQVFEEQKEGEDETRGGKKDNAKISKEFFVPLVIAGSALFVTLIAIFVRHRRARKR